jgi:hypothetical protein
VVPELVTRADDPTPSLRNLGELSTGHEERRANAAALEYPQDAVDDGRSRTVIERERDATLGRLHAIDEPADYLERARSRELPKAGDGDDQQKQPSANATDPLRSPARHDRR